MGLFSKIKSMFSKVNEVPETEITEVKEEISTSIVEKDIIKEEIPTEIVEKEVDEEELVEIPTEIVEKVIEEKEISTESVKKEKKEKTSVEDKDIPKVDVKKAKVYEKGLTKTRNSFVSSLIGLTNKYEKINEEYFEELEEILIMADIGVNTVMKFMDRLRDRVKKDKIDNPEDLKEVIVDELFIIYVDDSILESILNLQSQVQQFYYLLGLME